MIRETSKKDISSISDDSLRRYIFHEADTGLREVVSVMMQDFIDSEWSIGILDIAVPRAFCDLNRLRNRACPPILEPEKWLEIYDLIQKEV